MSSPGAGERVVIQPDELRRVATRMRGGAEVLSSAGRHLATRLQPELPAGLGAHVERVVQDANRELQELSLELIQTAGDLSVRATQAELGDIDPVAWLMPTLHGFGSRLDLGGAASLPPTGRLIEGRQGPAWAESVLQDMFLLEPVPGDFDLGDFAGSLEASLQELSEMPPAGLMLDLFGEPGDGSGAETGAAGGALASALEDGDLGPTGLGLVGCLLTGGSSATGDEQAAEP